MPEDMTSENPKGPEKPEFKPSWLVRDVKDKAILDSIKNDSLKRRVSRLHEAAKMEGLLNRELWTQEYLRLMHDADENKYPEDNDNINAFLLNMATGIQAMDEKNSSIRSETGALGSRVEELLEAQVQYQEAQVELMMKGYKGFIQGIKARAHVNPEQYDQSLPPWFERLSDREQSMFRNILHINYLASLKRDQGDAWLGELKGLRIERDSLEDMERLMPGFRVGFVTMFKDIFKQEGDHLVISGTKANKETGAGPTEGYAFLESERSLKAYKTKKTNELAGFLEKDPIAVQYAKNHHVSVEDLAAVAIATADNFFFGTGAYDSADEIRGMSPGDSDVCTEAVRIFFMPGTKGESKWLLAKTPEEITKQKEEKGVAEEDFGGILGGWIRENASVNRDGFRDKLQTNEIRLIPDRLFFSLIDHATFKEDASTFPKATLAQALIQSNKIPVAPGLWDFEKGNDEVNFSELSATELLSDYADTRGAAVKIFKHITVGKTEDILDNNGLINALIKARKDTLVNDIFRDEDLVTACIIMRARPPGLMRGISEMVLNVPENLYDLVVYNLTLDDRLFDGMPSGFRTRLLRRLHARDLSDTGAKNFLTRLGGGGVIDERRKLRDKAANNLTKGK